MQVPYFSLEPKQFSSVSHKASYNQTKGKVRLLFPLVVISLSPPNEPQIVEYRRAYLEAAKKPSPSFNLGSGLYRICGILTKHIFGS